MSLRIAFSSSLTCQAAHTCDRGLTVSRQALAVKSPHFRHLIRSRVVGAALLPKTSFAASRACIHVRSVACRSAEEVLELSEDNVEEALQDAKQELMQLFDESVGITGTVQLAELDGPFVKLRLQGRFWHKRADVLARVAAYLQRRIPDIMEVDIEDDAQLDDSAAAFDHS